MGPVKWICHLMICTAAHSCHAFGQLNGDPAQSQSSFLGHLGPVGPFRGPGKPRARTQGEPRSRAEGSPGPGRAQGQGAPCLSQSLVLVVRCLRPASLNLWCSGLALLALPLPVFVAGGWVFWPCLSHSSVLEAGSVGHASPTLWCWRLDL